MRCLPGKSLLPLISLTLACATHPDLGQEGDESDTAGETEGGDPAACWSSTWTENGPIVALWGDGEVVVAVGRREIHVFDGASWTEHHLDVSAVDPAPIDIEQAWIVATDDVYLGAYHWGSQHLLHWDGAEVTEVALEALDVPPEVSVYMKLAGEPEPERRPWLSTLELGCADCPSQTDVFTLLRLEEGEWVEQPAPAFGTSYGPLSLHLGPDGERWASGTELSRWDGASWVPEANPLPVEVEALWSDGDGTIWIGGESWIGTLDGAELQELPDGEQVERLLDVGESAPWLLGRTDGAGSDANLRRFDGLDWSVELSLSQLTSAASEAGESLLFADYDVGPRIARYDFDELTHIHAALELPAIHDVAEAEGVLAAVGGDSLMWRDALGEWTRERVDGLLEYVELRGVYLSSADTGWVAANRHPDDDGPILYRIVEGELVAQDDPEDGAWLQTIWGDEPDEVYLGGQVENADGFAPRLWRWDGSEWSNVTPAGLGSRYVADITRVDGELLLTLHRGQLAVARFDGQSWSVTEGPIGTAWGELVAEAADRWWVYDSTSQQVFEWNGEQWSAPLGTEPFRGIMDGFPTGLWLLGEDDVEIYAEGERLDVDGLPADYSGADRGFLLDDGEVILSGPGKRWSRSADCE